MEDKKDLYLSVDKAIFDAIDHGKQHGLTIGLEEDNKEELIYAQGNSIMLMTDELPEISAMVRIFITRVCSLISFKTSKHACCKQSTGTDARCNSDNNESWHTLPLEL